MSHWERWVSSNCYGVGDENTIYYTTKPLIMDLEKYQKDIVGYVENVLHDEDYIYNKFIPIILPRRMGKTTIANELRQSFSEFNYDLIILDEEPTVVTLCEKLTIFRNRDKVLIYLYTIGDDDSIGAKISKCPCIMGIINDKVLDVRFPDNTVISYPLDDMGIVSNKKENEINRIYNILSI
jgi:hypothetical protein